MFTASGLEATRVAIIHSVVSQDLHTAEGVAVFNKTEPTMALTVMKEKDYYRVAFDTIQAKISVTYLGIESVDDSLSSDYDCVEQLPQWMQERLAMLNMLSYEPPTEIVDGVGRRISKSTYWVEKPDVC